MTLLLTTIKTLNILYIGEGEATSRLWAMMAFVVPHVIIAKTGNSTAV